MEHTVLYSQKVVKLCTKERAGRGEHHIMFCPFIKTACQGEKCVMWLSGCELAEVSSSLEMIAESISSFSEVVKKKMSEKNNEG